MCQQRDIKISVCYLFLPLVDFVSYFESITENDICESKKKKRITCTIKKNGLGGKRKAVERFVKNGVSTKNETRIEATESFCFVNLKKMGGGIQSRTFTHIFDNVSIRPKCFSNKKKTSKTLQIFCG